MTPHLEARGLTLQRGGKTLIDQLDLTIACGSYTAIIGPNGAGKTTLIKLLCGDYHPQHGGREPLPQGPLQDLRRLVAGAGGL